MSTAAVPVIVGSGITGLSISRTLAQAGIDHVMVGKPPAKSGPRLGESLNLEGSADYIDMFPDLRQHAYAKTSVTFYMGDYVSSCPFALAPSVVKGYGMLGFKNLDWFLHIDRTAFDHELYDITVANPHCRNFESFVEDMDYDADSDRIRSMTLDSGEHLETSYVFDGTNHFRLLARKIGIPIEFLSDFKRVVATRYIRPSNGHKRDAWELTTNLIRHIPSTDEGLDGMSWVIPMGDTISVGVSVAMDADVGDVDQLLDKVAASFRRRGVDYRRFTERTEVMDIKTRYYIHERAHGPNWLLAGPSFCQVWFMSGAGVGTSFAAARLAPRLLEDPERVGAEYEAFQRNLRATHKRFAWMAEVDPYTLHWDKMIAKGDRIIGNAIRRMMDYVLLHGSPGQKIMARGLRSLVKVGRLPRGYCSSAMRPMGHQASMVQVAYNTIDQVKVVPPVSDSLPAPADPDCREMQVLEMLNEMLCGRVSVDEASKCMHPDLVMHLDDDQLNGMGAWFAGIKAILHRGRAHGLQAEVNEIYRDGDRWRVVGHWSMAGGNGNGKGLSPGASVTFRFEDGLIKEIWSSRHNYYYPLGRNYKTKTGFKAALAYWWLRSRYARGGEPAIAGA